MGRILHLLIWTSIVACAPATQPPTVNRGAAGRPVTVFLAPNARDVDGTPGYIHWSPRDMPIRVFVSPLSDSHLRVSSSDVAAEFVRAALTWEMALRTKLPWLEFSFVESADDADVTVRWSRSRRIDAATDFGYDSNLRPRHELVVNTGHEVARYIDFRLVAIHEVGHMLGLGESESGDTVMNGDYLRAYRTADVVVPTDSDVATVCALHEWPSGYRVDGSPFSGVSPQPPDTARCR